MISKVLTVVSNVKLADGIYEMRFSGANYVVPGSFLEVTVPGFYLNRPFGVGNYENGEITIYYKVVGNGTDKMTEIKAGTELKVIYGLGNGFNMARAKKPLLVSGGIGIAPIYYLAKAYANQGIRPIVVTGFRNAGEVVLSEELNKIADLIVCTDDGSMGFNGNPVSAVKALDKEWDYYYACGPMVMMKYLKMHSAQGELSLEARMGCGFGACMGCSIITKSGYKRVCKEGPVFDASEVEL
ncbi:MAG: dihydroorotate dehydrogenase electron transfer subunit [Clostridia bacterium]|nr:dihydroorotate dehydrogenase electron transfer subunit [Clostridia bacterium]